MKFYRCLDCRDTDKPGCELYIDGDTQPPNVCPYRYGKTWEKNGGKCGWEFVGMSAEMPVAALEDTVKRIERQRSAADAAIRSAIRCAQVESAKTCPTCGARGKLCSCRCGE